MDMGTLKLLVAIVLFSVPVILFAEGLPKREILGRRLTRPQGPGGGRRGWPGARGRVPVGDRVGRGPLTLRRAMWHGSRRAAPALAGRRFRRESQP
jgi:hypothetical protein